MGRKPMENHGNILNSNQNNYLSPKDVEERLGLSHGTVNKLFHVKGFPVVRIGRTMRVKESDFENFMDSYKTHVINI